MNKVESIDPLLYMKITSKVYSRKKMRKNVIHNNLRNYENRKGKKFKKISAIEIFLE
jgi:hypothetical protein